MRSFRISSCAATGARGKWAEGKTAARFLTLHMTIIAPEDVAVKEDLVVVPLGPV